MSLILKNFFLLINKCFLKWIGINECRTYEKAVELLLFVFLRCYFSIIFFFLDLVTNFIKWVFKNFTDGDVWNFDQIEVE